MSNKKATVLILIIVAAAYLLIFLGLPALRLALGLCDVFAPSLTGGQNAIMAIMPGLVGAFMLAIIWTHKKTID